MKSPARSALLCAGLALCTLAALWPVLRGGFIVMDDPKYVTSNPMVTGDFSWTNARILLTHSHEFLYHPLSLLSFMVDHRLWGLNPLGYHAVNLALHTGSVCLLFLLLRWTTGSNWRSALAALLFGIHPLRVESVAWVSERKDVLSLFFAMLGFLAYAGYVRFDARKAISWSCYVLTFVCLALSLLAKPTLVTFPFLLLLLDYWPLRRFDRAGGLAPAKTPLRLLLEKLPLLALAITLGYLSSSMASTEITHGETFIDTQENASLGARLAAAPVVCVIYLFHHLWFGGLAIPYPAKLEGYSSVQVTAGVLLLAAITMLAAYQARRRPWMIVGWAWFLIALAPLLGIIYIGDYALADRYTYLADVGLMIALVWSIPQSLERTPASRGLLGAAIGAVVIVLVFFSRVQAGYWRNDATLFGHSAAVTTDNAWALWALAQDASNRGDHAASIDYYNRALQLAPDERLEFACGREFARTGQPLVAIQYFTRALRHTPQFPECRFELAKALHSAGDDSGAHEELQNVLSMRPNFRPAIDELIALDGHVENLQSIEDCRKALLLAPNDPAIHTRLGVFLDEKELSDEAIAEYRRALELDPTRTGPRVNLAADLVDRGKLAEAVDEYRKVLALAPHDSGAQLGLARALIPMAHPIEAIAACRAALVTLPDSFDAHFMLGTALRKLGHINEAATEFELAHRARPNDADTNAALASLFSRRKR